MAGRRRAPRPSDRRRHSRSGKRRTASCPPGCSTTSTRCSRRKRSSPPNPTASRRSRRWLQGVDNTRWERPSRSDPRRLARTSDRPAVGKPVEKIPRHGIRAIAESTGNWPISTYFTAIGLDPDVAAAYPWNRAPRTTSPRREHRGMPEDDDLNFAIVALMLVEQHGAPTTDDVAAAWLSLLPGGRASRLNGLPTATSSTATPRPSREEWAIRSRTGSAPRSVRTCTAGCCRVNRRGSPPGVAGRPAEPLAQRPVRGDVRRRGVVHGRRRAIDRRECVEAGLSVVPAVSRYAVAIRRGTELGQSSLRPGGGDRHDLRRVRPPPLGSRAQQRRSSGVRPDPQRRRLPRRRSRPSCQSLGHRLDGCDCRLDLRRSPARSNFPSVWTDPLANRLSTSMPGLDGIGFDELARRTAAARLT